MEQLLLRPVDAARVLSLGRSKLYELLAAGDLPSVKIGRATRIPAASLRDWVERRASGSENSASTESAP
jgi:excisionase family DNA binding protein